MYTESLKATEAECAAGRTAPRVSLADIDKAIVATHHFTAGAAIRAIGEAPSRDEHDLLSICIMTHENGFTVIGKSAPASAANFDPVLGRKLAHEDAIRQFWPLMGFALRDRSFGVGKIG